MQLLLEDVIAVLEELERDKEKLALLPAEEALKQYTNLGVALGVKQAILKLQNHYGRESY